jgi:hypothetical protein
MLSLKFICAKYQSRILPSGFQLVSDLKTERPCGIRRPIAFDFGSPLMSETFVKSIIVPSSTYYKISLPGMFGGKASVATFIKSCCK